MKESSTVKVNEHLIQENNRFIILEENDDRFKGLWIFRILLQ
jgi:hypothetical protein